MHLFSLDDITDIFQVNKTAIMDLVNKGSIPYTRIKYTDGDIIRFEQDAISGWLLKNPEFNFSTSQYDRQYVESYKRRLELQYPEAMRKIKEYGRQFSDTHKAPRADLYDLMIRYYAKDSPYLAIDTRRGRILSENARRIYHGFVSGQWVPYLRKNKIKIIEEIDTPFLARFQNQLLSQGIKPQTINHGISFIKKIFDHLVIAGNIKHNPCANLTSLKLLDDSCEIRGCYEIGALRGVFNTKWGSEVLYLLALLIYTTGMRNSEIERIQVKDIVSIDKYFFIDIPKSKTKYGARMVPLHHFVHRKLAQFIEKKGKKGDDYIFSFRGRTLGSNIYKGANRMLGTFTGHDAARLKKEGITFYSGRHFWKTLMNSENLGDIEEYFMGHRISSDVAKRYNHRDKQGRQKFLERTKRVFSILDQWIFRQD